MVEILWRWRRRCYKVPSCCTWGREAAAESRSNPSHERTLHCGTCSKVSGSIPNRLQLVASLHLHYQVCLCHAKQCRVSLHDDVKFTIRLGAIHLWRPQKNQAFDPSPLSTCIHMGQTRPSPLWTSTRGRHEKHTALLKRLVQWPSGPKAEIRLYDCNLFKTVLLVIYTTNLYRRKISTFYSVQRRNSGKIYTNFFAWEEDRMMSVDSNFNFLCIRPHGAWPPTPSKCDHLSLKPSPLCVDIINGWHLKSMFDAHPHLPRARIKWSC